jgi:multisubunit Na+/H+ antiporter MnhB subunit
MVNEKGVPSQGWYGMVGFAFVVGAAVSVVLYVLVKRLAPSEAELRPGGVKLIAYASVLIVVACMVYCALYEFLKWDVL